MLGKENPKEFYNKNIIPYKSDLELWYIQNNSFSLYIKIIFVTAYVVIFPKSNIFERLFKDIPKKPEFLV